jgi:hypothetical protein
VSTRRIRPRLRTRRTSYRPYALAWLGLVVLGVTNGALRVALYDRRLGDQRAHQLSTATAVVLFAAYIYAVDRRWPPPSQRAAVGIGAAWSAATITFELGFGHYVAGTSWSELLHDYDIPDGRLWPLALATIATAPVVARKLHPTTS